MIEDPLGAVEYDERGQGPTIVFVPGSCSTGAAWRAVIAALQGDFRTITTSLPGYGRSAERRSETDGSIGPVASAIEAVVRRAGTAVHLVGHSFGGEAGLAVALRGRVPLASLSILEAPAPGILRAFGRTGSHDRFRAMTDAYFHRFRSGDAEAIGGMIDFYGGAGTWASWPAAVQAYAARTTSTNILDWNSAYALEYSAAALADLGLPVLVAVGERSHPAVREANSLIAEAIARPTLATIDGAAHFMTATHPVEVASLIAGHVSAAIQAG